MRPELIVVEDRAALVQRSARWIADAVAGAIGERGRCSLALAGGSTPRPVYERLSEPSLTDRIHWESVEIYFGDERCVPADHPDSNYGMAAEALLRRVPIPPALIHRMKGELADADAAAREYERWLPATLDILILGVGRDGHTASLFPNSPAMAEGRRRVVATSSPKPPVRRITVTPPVIASARSVLVIASGEDKADALARALEGPYTPGELPIQLACPGVWFIDRNAAARLRSVSARPPSGLGIS